MFISHTSYDVEPIRSFSGGNVNSLNVGLSSFKNVLSKIVISRCLYHSTSAT